MKVSWARGTKLLVVSVWGAALILAIAACIPWTPDAYRMDPGLHEVDPGALRADSWDRQAATAVERSRGIRLSRLLGDREHDLTVVSRLFASRARKSRAESASGRIPNDAPSVLLLRRARATYLVAARALEHADADARQWGLDAVELLEGRCHGGPAPMPPGPPHRGPERDGALAAVGRLFLGDPDPEVRSGAIFLTRRFPKAGEPSTEAVVSALAKETDKDNRTWMLWLLSEREAPAGVIFGAALKGFDDPVTVSVAIHDLFEERNRAVIEDAFERGDTVCRAAIGETFYRHQTSMPWAESIVFRGLADPEQEVRARFAKGSLVLRPASPRLRRVLESLRAETANAAWALGVMDEGSRGEADGDD